MHRLIGIKFEVTYFSIIMTSEMMINKQTKKEE